MFTIGLFSTQLPFLILACLYGAFIGIHSIAKFEASQEAEPDSCIASGTIILENHPNHSNYRKTIHFDEYCSFSEADTPRLFADRRSLIIALEKKNPHPPFSPYSLYSRPPPLA